MSEYVVMPKSDYVSACDAIRAKSGSTELIKSNELADAINQLGTYKEEQEKTIDITKNGTTEIPPDEGKVLSKVTVNVDVPSEDTYHQLFWNNYQCFGDRVDYEKAFYNAGHTIWIADMIQPIYDFTVNIANSMFRGLTDLTDFNTFLEDRNVTFNFILSPQNQALASAGYMFSGCTSLKSVVGLNCEKVSTIIYMFNSCHNLETVHLKNLQKTTNIDGVFNQCYVLKNLTIENGEISSNINLGDSSQLTDLSIDSIETALVDLTGQTSKNIILNKAVIERMSDEQKLKFTNKNWTIVSKG